MKEANYKAKYEAIKLKFMNSVDTAYRLGFEDGAKNEQNNQVQQAQQQAAQASNVPGQENEEGAEQQNDEQTPDSAHPDGSELDQHISQLEQLLGKSEFGSDEMETLKKSLNEIKIFTTSIKQSSDIKKAQKAIENIGKALKTPKMPFKLSQQASHNMPDSAKKAVNMQEEIVNSIMKSWKEEEEKASKDIKNILTIEGLFNKKD